MDAPVAERFQQDAKDLPTAVGWYEAAAQGGHIKAQCVLGTLFRDGNGVRKSYARAKLWFNGAASRLRNTILC